MDKAVGLLSPNTLTSARRDGFTLGDESSASSRGGRTDARRSPEIWRSRRFSKLKLLVPAVVLLGSLISPLWMGAEAAAASSPPVPAKFAVGEVTDTFVDTHRTTPAWNQSPALPTRTLVTTILYPATGAAGGDPTPGAAPDKAAGPFPLIVFAHGLGGTPQGYITLLTDWASEGFVVAAPLFPLSNGNVPGGPDAGDVVNQPEDMSYVINSVSPMTRSRRADPLRAGQSQGDRCSRSLQRSRDHARSGREHVLPRLASEGGHRYGWHDRRVPARSL